MQPGLLTQAFANDGNIEEDSHDDGHDDGHDDDHVDKEGKQMAARSALGLARASLLLPTPSLPFLTSGKFLMGKIVNRRSCGHNMYNVCILCVYHCIMLGAALVPKQYITLFIYHRIVTTLRKAQLAF